MKICYIVPGMMEPEEMRRRENLLRKWASPGTEVDLICTDGGPASIESAYEEYISISLTAEAMLKAQNDGYDAAILGCAGDPGLDAMREVTDKMLVVGPGAASYLAAAMLGHNFAVLTVDDSMLHSCYELGYKAGCLDKVVDAIAVNIPVLELNNDRGATLKKMAAACQNSIDQKHADCIVLGCMSMGFLDVAEELSQMLGVPVINPSKNALRFTEALVGAGLRHSKKAFATPPKLRDGRVKSLAELYEGRK